MQKVIDRKLYDTETANQIANWSNGRRCTDFAYIEETLYQTKKGNWFLHYEGGAASQYSKSVTGGSAGSEGIKALDNEEAYDWLEAKADADTIKEYFRDEIEEA